MKVLAAASLALLAGAGLAATAPAAGGHDLKPLCEADDHGSITAEEAKPCVRESFALVSGGGDAITEAQLADAYGRAEAAQRLFARIDRNGDGRITPEEWSAWHDTEFAAATESNQGSRRAAD